MTHVDLYSFPRCASYLGAVDERALKAPEVTQYWAAVIIADAMPTSQLESSGFVWPDGERDAAQILSGLERALSAGKVTKDLVGADLASFKSFIGARGIKVSRLRGNTELLTAVKLLWPEICGCCESLKDAHSKIKGMTKRQRRSNRIDELRAARPEWFQ